MVLLLKQWRAKRDLLNLSKRSSFSNIKPQTVIEVLERFASLHDRDNQKSTNSSLRTSSNKEQRRALLVIWEHARKRVSIEPNHKDCWRRVMVSCNALYESSLGTSPQATSNQIAA